MAGSTVPIRIRASVYPQAFSFPTVYSQKHKALQAAFLAAQAQTQLTEQELRAGIRTLFL